MTFDPHRVNMEYGMLRDTLKTKAEVWKEYGEDEDLEEYERKAYRHCATEIEKLLEKHD